MILGFMAGCPRGPSTQYLGTWDLGNSNFCTGLGKYMILGHLEPSGGGFRVW